MNSAMLIHSLILIAGVFISNISQIVLKKSADKKYDSVIKEYLNPMVIGAYAVFFIATFLTIYAYKVVPLSMGPILESSGYLFMIILGAIFLKEKPTKRKLLATFIIIIGIVVYSV
ncbi:EamA-like transporter family protein [Oscillospiraceae bacterium]|nr:EamA-like transporter family protein [Oscillospiraceae bacterium]